MITFEQYLDYRSSISYEDQINEAEFFKNLWQKAKDSYTAARGNPEDDVQLKNSLEGWSDKVSPHVAKAAKIAGEYANKLNISVPLATAVVLSGMLGGPAAVPMSVLMYYVNKPVGKAASKVFDKGVAAIQNLTGQNKQNQINPMSQAGKPAVPGVQPKPTNNNENYNSLDKLSDNSDLEYAFFYIEQYSRKFDFQSYAAIRELQEGKYGDYTRQAGQYVGSKVKDFGNWLGGKVDKGHELASQYAKQTKQWWDEKGSDQVSGAIGKGLGFIAGKAAKYSGNISHLITSSFSSMAKWASQNKLPIAKTMFLMAVGAATGLAVGAAVNFVAAKAMALSKTVKPEEVNDWLKENFKMEIKQDENGNYEVYGDQHYTSTGAKPHHTEVGDYMPDQYVTHFKNHIKDVTDGLKTDTFTQVNFSKLIDKSVGPDVMGLNFHGTITPQAGESVKDVLNRAYQSLKDNLAEKGFTADIEQFKQISAYANKGYYPDQPIQVAAIIKPATSSANLIGGAVGGAVGAKTGAKGK